MSRNVKIALVVCAALWLIVVGVYLGNPFGTATWDPRGRLFGHVPYRIPSQAMSPTLMVGDIVVAKTYVYAWSEPRRGDLLVFVSPTDGHTLFVQRVIGAPGDEVSIRDGILYINGDQTPEPYLQGVILEQPFSRYFTEITVPSRSLFVLGDNRDNSNDSRFWGFVPRDNVVGRIDCLWYANEFHRAGEVARGS